MTPRPTTKQRREPRTPTGPVCVTANGLAIGYHAPALIQNITFSFQAGQIIAVIGPNGAGKSTFLKTLLGILPPVAGTLDWSGGKPAEIAYLGQLTEFDRRFPLRVRDLVSVGAWHGLGLLGSIGPQRRERIARALRLTGVARIADVPLHQLSTGQLQRALFARTMVQDTELILLDEPFAAVDQTTEAQLRDVIETWRTEGRTIVIVVHDLATVLEICDQALLLGNGRAMFGAPRAVLTPQSLVAHGYMSDAQARWLEQLYASSTSSGQDDSGHETSGHETSGQKTSGQETSAQNYPDQNDPVGRDNGSKETDSSRPTASYGTIIKAAAR